MGTKTARKFVTIALYAVIFLSLICHSKSEGNSENELLSSEIKFTSNLHTYLKNKPGNLLYSPFSIYSILSTIYQGAEGTTKDLLKQALYLPEKKSTAETFDKIITDLNDKTDVKLSVANKIYVKSDHAFNSEFKQVATDQFHSEVESVDFSNNQETAEKINSWVKERSENRIDKLIDPASLNVDTHMVLANVIYFKGSWYNPFMKEVTQESTFYVDKDTAVQVPFMYLDARVNFNNDHTLGAKVIELPFTNQEFSMIAFLPFEKYGIEELEEKLTQNNFNIVEGVRRTKVRIHFPKFMIEDSIDIEETLKHLGLEELFDASSCDLSGIFEDKEPLFVTKVKTATYLKVDEDGLEAAGASGLVTQSRSLSMNEFIADHPFIFTIVNKKSDVNNVLFVGRVMNPLN